MVRVAENAVLIQRRTEKKKSHWSSSPRVAGDMVDLTGYRRNWDRRFYRVQVMWWLVIMWREICGNLSQSAFMTNILYHRFS